MRVGWCGIGLWSWEGKPGYGVVFGTVGMGLAKNQGRGMARLLGLEKKAKK